jgi:hypothetical protein
MKRLYIALTDLWHLLLGIATALLARNHEVIANTLSIHPFLGIIIPLSIIAIYIAYQSLDDDTPEERAGDLLEYAIGLIAGSIIQK